MHPVKRIRTFTERHPFIGPAVWMLTAHYFITQVVVAAAWKTPYSWLHNPISDLGNTECGLYAGRYVCSPLHGLMNASFILLGLLMALGSLLIYQGFKKSEGTLLGFSFMATAGLGALLVGAFPENTISSLHTLGALLPFLFGNLALVILAFALDMPGTLRIYTLLSGIIALLALVAYGLGFYFGLGEGGMERLVAYPQTIWLIVFGIYISAHRYRIERSKH